MAFNARVFFRTFLDFFWVTNGGFSFSLAGGYSPMLLPYASEIQVMEVSQNCQRVKNAGGGRDSA